MDRGLVAAAASMAFMYESWHREDLLRFDSCPGLPATQLYNRGGSRLCTCKVYPEHVYVERCSRRAQNDVNSGLCSLFWVVWTAAVRYPRNTVIGILFYI